MIGSFFMKNTYETSMIEIHPTTAKFESDFGFIFSPLLLFLINIYKIYSLWKR